MPRLSLIFILLLSAGAAPWANAQPKTLTVRLSTHGNISFRAVNDEKNWGLQGDHALIKQQENRNGLLIYTPDAAKGREHSPFTIGLLPNHPADFQLVKGDVQFDEIDNPITGRMGSGKVMVKGGNAQAFLQLQSGDIHIQQSRWRGSVMTRKGNILLEDSPLLEALAFDGTVTHRYTETGLKDQKQLIQTFDKGRLELIGSVPQADLQLQKGDILLEGYAERAYLAIRDRGNITVKRSGLHLEARTKNGDLTIHAPENFETMTLLCENGTVNLHIPRSFQGTVKLLCEVSGREKPEFKISHFWQEKAADFEPITAEGKAVPGLYRYSFEKKTGNGATTLFIHVKNGNLLIQPLP